MTRAEQIHHIDHTALDGLQGLEDRRFTHRLDLLSDEDNGILKLPALLGHLVNVFNDTLRHVND